MNKNENKLHGSLKVSADVILKIAETAASEIDGVVVNSGNKLAVLEETPIISKMVSPVKVKLTADSAIINVSIITEQGYKAYEVAKSVQSNVKSAVQSMTGIAVSKVNVKIVGINMEKTK